VSVSTSVGTEQPGGRKIKRTAWANDRSLEKPLVNDRKRWQAKEKAVVWGHGAARRSTGGNYGREETNAFDWGGKEKTGITLGATPKKVWGKSLDLVKFRLHQTLRLTPFLFSKTPLKLLVPDDLPPERGEKGSWWDKDGEERVSLSSSAED